MTTQRDLFGDPVPLLESSQWFTPVDLARRMAAWVPREASMILEPMAGDGELVSALAYHGHNARKVTAVEIVPETSDALRTRFPDAHVHTGDVFEVSKRWAPRRFDVGISNPVYENNLHFETLALMLRHCKVAIELAPLAMECTPERCAWLLQHARMRRRAVVGWRVRFRGPEEYRGKGGMIEVSVTEWTSRQPWDPPHELVINERWMRNDPIASWTGALPMVDEECRERPWSPIAPRSASGPA